MDIHKWQEQYGNKLKKEIEMWSYRKLIDVYEAYFYRKENEYATNGVTDNYRIYHVICNMIKDEISFKEYRV